MGAADPLPGVRVEVLGPLRLLVGDAPVDVRGPKRRAVLALLALAEGRTVTADGLVDALWPSDAPESGRQALQTHVSRLRAHLGGAAGRVQTRHEGYRLDLGPDDLDLTRARALLAAGRAAAGDPPRALALLREAHGLWRGPMLPDLTDLEPIATAVQGCARLHRDVTDALVASAIHAREADEVLGLAAASVDNDPLREPAVLLLMRALAATARAPEALDTGRAYRHRLAEETGLDPTPALGELEREIAGGALHLGPARQAARPPAPAGPATRLIGRDTHVASLHRLLAAQRLVTIVGPGGVGKTRVALEVARPDAAATVLLLAPVTDPSAVPHALAAALNLTVVHGDVLAACVAVLGDRPGLLVIDNCEHLLDAVRDAVGVILAGCPGLAVLATSRERLGLAAEYTFRLPPLLVPSAHPGTAVAPDTTDAAALALVPSVAVFLDRAARVRAGGNVTPADLDVIADIVRRLDGMPLAIELAAGRLSSFSLDDLHRRLDRSLDLLGSGRPSGDARHRTLRATVAWSYELLPEPEQRLFRHLAVFVDGVDLEAAERLAVDLGLDTDPGSLLAHLVDASMIDADLTAGTRYRMLDTLRAFGLDRLAAAGEEEAAARRLICWAVDLTEWIGGAMVTEREPDADAALRRELANLRAAWRLLRRGGSIDDAVAFLVGLFEAVAYRDLLEIRGWATELTADPALEGHPRATAVLGIAAEAAYHRGDYPAADRLARAGLAAPSEGADTWFCLSVLAVADLARAAHADAVEHSLAAAAVAPGPRESLGLAALATAYAGDPGAARPLNERGRDGARSPTMIAWGEYVAGEIESVAGFDGRADSHYVRAVELARTSGATFLVGVASVGLLAARSRAGRVQDALRGFRDVIDYFDRTGNWMHQWTTLRNLAALLRQLGDNEPAALLDAAADRAPDAPAVVPPADGEPPSDRAAAAGPGRADALETARRALDRHLGSSPAVPAVPAVPATSAAYGAGRGE